MGAAARSWRSCRRGRPAPIGLGSGQAAFTIFVVVLFNLAAPAGAQTAVLRLETVATGIVVAVVSGFVFWPRGPQASLGPIAGRLYRASAATLRTVSADSLGLDGAGDGLVRGPPRAGRGPRAARGDAPGAGRRPPRRRRRHRPGGDHDPAVDRAGRRLGPQPTSGLGTIGPAEGRPARPPAELEAEAFEVAARFDAVAEALEHPGGPTARARRRPAQRPAPPRRPRAASPAEFLRLAWLWTWLTTVDELAARHRATSRVATVRGLPDPLVALTAGPDRPGSAQV